jgi:hypothetical protein
LHLNEAMSADMVWHFYWVTPGSGSCPPGCVESGFGLAARRRRRSAVKTAAAMGANAVYKIVVLVEDFVWSVQLVLYLYFGLFN